MTESLEIRPRTRADDDRLSEIVNSFEDVFVFTPEVLRYYVEERVRPGNIRPEIMVAAQDGEVLGYWWLEAGWWAETPGVFFGEVGVDHSLWGQGVGTTLWKDLEQKLAGREVAKTYARTVEGVGEAERFARRWGFEKTGRVGRASRLKVAEARLEGYDGIQERLAAESISIVPMSQLDMNDDRLMHALHTALQEAVSDIPSTEEFKGQAYDVWRQNFLKTPGTSAHTYWVAIHNGTPVAAANLDVRDKGHVFNGFTGVARDFRGKGVARALKLETIKWARANAVENIDTENDVENRRMLDINVRLGYKPLPGREEWVKHYGG